MLEKNLIVLIVLLCVFLLLELFIRLKAGSVIKQSKKYFVYLLSWIAFSTIAFSLRHNRTENTSFLFEITLVASSIISTVSIYIYLFFRGFPVWLTFLAERNPDKAGRHIRALDSISRIRGNYFLVVFGLTILNFNSIVRFVLMMFAVWN